MWSLRGLPWEVPLRCASTARLTPSRRSNADADRTPAENRRCPSDFSLSTMLFVSNWSLTDGIICLYPFNCARSIPGAARASLLVTWLVCLRSVLFLASTWTMIQRVLHPVPLAGIFSAESFRANPASGTAPHTQTDRPASAPTRCCGCTPPRFKADIELQSPPSRNSFDEGERSALPGPAPRQPRQSPYRASHHALTAPHRQQPRSTAWPPAPRSCEVGPPEQLDPAGQQR